MTVCAKNASAEDRDKACNGGYGMDCHRRVELGWRMNSIEIDPYVLDVLMPDLVGHDRKPGSLLLYLYLHRRVRADGSRQMQIPLRELAERTGLSKRDTAYNRKASARKRPPMGM